MARKKVEKNISYDDEKKTYYVNLDYGKDETGKRIKKNKTFAKISEARKALKDHEANKTKGTLVIPKDLTLKDWLEYWMNDVIKPTRAATTVYGYQKIIDNHIAPEMGKTLLQQLSGSQIQRYYAKLSRDKKLSQNTIRKHHDLLNTALKLAVRQDVVLKNPLDKVDPPRPEDYEAKFYTPEQLATLLKLVHGDRLEIVVYLAVFLGLRRSEILGLYWDDVDFGKRIIHIRHARLNAGKEMIIKNPKSKSSKRDLFISDELFEALERELKKQQEDKAYLDKGYNDSGFVVVCSEGNPYKPNYIDYLFSKFIKDSNLPSIKLHELRHSFASVANAANVTLYDISKSLGHSSTAITAKIYTHVIGDHNKGTIQKVAGEIDLKAKKE